MAAFHSSQLKLLESSEETSNQDIPDITITKASREESVTTTSNSTASNHKVELEATSDKETSDKETTGKQRTLINNSKNETAVTESKLKSALNEIDQALEIKTPATQPQLSHNRYQLKTFDHHLPAIDHDTQTEKGHQQKVDSEHTETQNENNQDTDSEDKVTQTEDKVTQTEDKVTQTEDSVTQTENTPRLPNTRNTKKRFWTLQRKWEEQSKEENTKIKTLNEIRIQRKIDKLETELKQAKENETKAQSELKEAIIAHYQELTKVTNENQHKILQLSMSESDLKNKLERVRAKAKGMHQKLQAGQRRTRRMLASLQKCSAELELDSYSDNEDTDDSSPPPITIKSKWDQTPLDDEHLKAGARSPPYTRYMYNKSAIPQHEKLLLALDAKDPIGKPKPSDGNRPQAQKREQPTFEQMDDWLKPHTQLRHQSTINRNVIQD